MAGLLVLYLVTLVISTARAQTTCLAEHCTPCYQEACTIDSCYIHCPCQFCPEGFAQERDGASKTCQPFPDDAKSPTIASHLDSSNLSSAFTTSTASATLNATNSTPITTSNPKLSVTTSCYKCHVTLCSECAIDNYVSGCLRCQSGHHLITVNGSASLCSVDSTGTKPTSVGGADRLLNSEALTAGIVVAGVSLLAVSAGIIFLLKRRRHLVQRDDETPDSMELQDSSVNNFKDRLRSHADGEEESTRSRVSKFSSSYNKLSYLDENGQSASTLTTMAEDRFSSNDYRPFDGRNLSLRTDQSSEDLDCTLGQYSGACMSAALQEDNVYSNDGYVSLEEGDQSALSENFDGAQELEKSTNSQLTEYIINVMDNDGTHDLKQPSPSVEHTETMHDSDELSIENCDSDRRSHEGSDRLRRQIKPLTYQDQAELSTPHQHHCSNSWARRKKTNFKISDRSQCENPCDMTTESSVRPRRFSRSYISIPPTSPSEKYIEAASDIASSTAQTDRSTKPFQLEWLTKSFTLDRKNELSTYQTSTAVQTESSVVTPIKQTVFGSPWQFGGTFTNHGGLLQAGDSDVALTVPSGAVPRDQAIDIYGAVFTNTLEIRNKLKIPSDESLISPVVEYISLPTGNFERHVRIELPHALQSDFDVENMKVYTFTVDEFGNVDLSCVPFRDRTNTGSIGSEAFWEDGQDGGKICIMSTHFSGYFCTLCGSSGVLPSIYTMMFGSHVQIEHQNRREIRVVLYIWDRRLTIKDYLQRFCKQESESERELLTEMQVPLLNDASCDSRLVMRMEFLGYEEEQSLCWRHVARPGGSRYLFKPLQVRRLSEIVECCRHTDPIRVEWAVENKPYMLPCPVFQCCIDIMHAPDSTSDYETALNEDLDDLMRSFYVRNLKVTPSQDSLSSFGAKFEAPSPKFQFQPTQLKRTLSETLDLQQTEQLFLELGFASKDIGNFHKKFTSESAIKVALIEECIRRLGPDKLSTKLPAVLDNLRFLSVSKVLEKQQNIDLKAADKPSRSIKTCTRNRDGNEITVSDISLTEPKILTITNDALNGQLSRDKILQSSSKTSQDQNHTQSDKRNVTFQDPDQTSKKELFGSNIVA